MPEAGIYLFTHQEVVESLIKKQNIHEGIWGLIVTFGLNAVNAGQPPHEIFPAALIPVLKLGIRKTEKENNLTVDASKVNPLPKKEKSVAPTISRRGAPTIIPSRKK